MKTAFSILIAMGAAVTLAACSKAEEAPAATEAEVAPIPAEAPANDPASVLPPEAAAFVATLSPEELAQARLSCVEAIRTAKANPHIFDAELAEQLGEIDYLSRTELLTKPPLNSLSIEQARAIMDLAPQFNAKSQPTVDETTGVRQCVMLVKHYEAEKAAKG